MTNIFLEENKKFNPLFEQFKQQLIRDNPISFKEYIDLYLLYFGSYWERKFTDFCLYAMSKGYNYTSCTFKDLIVNRYREISSEPFGDLLLLDKKSMLTMIDKMTGNEFEDFINWMFIKLGYNTIKTKPGSDQGGDLIIKQLETSTIVQIKRWSKKVGNSAIQAVHSAKAYYKCNKAIVITNNYFTRNAIKLAEKCSVSLWDRSFLIEFFEKNKMEIFKNI